MEMTQDNFEYRTLAWQHSFYKVNMWNKILIHIFTFWTFCDQAVSLYSIELLRVYVCFLLNII